MAALDVLTRGGSQQLQEPMLAALAELRQWVATTVTPPAWAPAPAADMVTDPFQFREVKLTAEFFLGRCTVKRARKRSRGDRAWQVKTLNVTSSSARMTSTIRGALNDTEKTSMARGWMTRTNREAQSSFFFFEQW